MLVNLPKKNDELIYIVCIKKSSIMPVFPSAFSNNCINMGSAKFIIPPLI